MDAEKVAESAALITALMQSHATVTLLLVRFLEARGVLTIEQFLEGLQQSRDYLRDSVQDLATPNAPRYDLAAMDFILEAFSRASMN